MKVRSEEQTKKLDGLVEVMADRVYTKSSAIRRAENPPKDMFPGGEPFLISVPMRSASNRKITRYVAAWFVPKEKLPKKG